MRVPLALLPVLALALALPSGAHADVRPFGILDCVPREGTRFCEGSVAKRVKSFDGVPLDANVTLPATGDGPFPLIIGFHGYGGGKRRFDDMGSHHGPKLLAQRGFAVLNYSSRGFQGSCGTPEARLADPAGCARGWLHLDDVRYEVRDSQYLSGLLVDQGIADPQRIGAWADSYGGAPTTMLAILRDRIVLPDGRYAPWTSPKGVPMRLSGAAPYQTWNDLLAVLLPNGNFLDYAVARPEDSFSPPGAAKATFVAGLFATGQVRPPTSIIGYYAPPGLDLEADLTTGVARLLLGEPYLGDPVTNVLVRTSQRYRSAYHLKMDRPPAPIMVSSGWTDDLFPVGESLRLRNKIQATFPEVPVSVWLADFGHQRGQEKRADIDARTELQLAWLDHFVRGVGPRPYAGIEARTMTCPRSARSAGPFRAPTWAALHPGEVRMRSPQPQTVVSASGDPTVGARIDPVASGNNPCLTMPASDGGPGVASYRMPAASGDGYTLLGLPTVIARFEAVGAFPQIGARLWDVAPDGTQRLVTRGVYRPRGQGIAAFQLWGNGYRFEPGHVPLLELLGGDAPFIRPSNGLFFVTVRDLELRLPVRERPGAAPGVEAPAAPMLPTGVQRAPDLPPPAAAARRVAVRTSCGRGRARVRVTGARLRSVEVRRGGRRIARDARRPFSLALRRAALDGRRAARVEILVRRVDGSATTLRRRVRVC